MINTLTILLFMFSFLFSEAYRAIAPALVSNFRPIFDVLLNCFFLPTFLHLIDAAILL